MLELGSGTGVGGLYAAGLGAREVLLTDGRAGLAELQRANIRQNEHLLPDPARIACAQLRWGSDAPPPGPWDWVIGSGCTVEVADETMVALAATCAALLRPDGAPPPRLILAHDHRPNPDARGDVEPALIGGHPGVFCQGREEIRHCYCHVQHRIAEQGEELWSWIARGAVISSVGARTRGRWSGASVLCRML